MARILIVDDEPANRELLRLVLLQDAHELELAANGEDALSMVREHRFDLVIVDLYMPGMNGTQLIRALRNDEKTAATTLALYTGTSIDAALRDFMELTAISHVVPKPAEPHEILRAVRAALSSRQ